MKTKSFNTWNKVTITGSYWPIVDLDKQDEFENFLCGRVNNAVSCRITSLYEKDILDCDLQRTIYQTITSGNINEFFSFKLLCSMYHESRNQYILEEFDLDRVGLEYK